MKLEIIEECLVIDDPTPDQIALELQKIDREGVGAAILINDQFGDEYYMQTAGERGSGYVLEYREGGENQHFVAKDVDIHVDRIVEAFQRYSAGDGSWKGWHEWGRLEPAKGKSGCLGALVALLAGAGI